MKALISILALLLAGCAAPNRNAFKEPPGWNPQPLASYQNPFAAIAERGRLERAAQSEAMSAAREDYVAAHPELSARDRELVQQGRYAIGWTREMVQASKGEPQRMIETVSAFGQVESWIYRGGIELIQFVNGKLTSFHVER